MKPKYGDKLPPDSSKPFPPILTPDELDAISGRIKKATPGPRRWTFLGKTDNGFLWGYAEDESGAAQ